MEPDAGHGNGPLGSGLDSRPSATRPSPETPSTVPDTQRFRSLIARSPRSPRSTHLILPALLLALAGACATSSAPPPVRPPASVEIPDLDTRLAELGNRLEQERVALHIPGMAAGIVKDDRLIWARGFGLADVASKRAATPETLFAIGSTTKAFSAALAGTLVDEGKLEWDEPVEEILPGFHLRLESDLPNPRATLRDLFSHRSGFTRMGILWAAGTASRDEILAAATRAEPWAPFRSGFHYNNVMVMAAGEATARAAGMSWRELLRERILGPLGMEDTNVSLDAAKRSGLLATGYDYDEESGELERQTMRDLTSIAPAGAINSNVRDMAKWLRLLIGRGRFEGRRVVSEAQLQETWRPAIAVTPSASYGMGWFLSEWNGYREIEHGGNIDGFAAEVALLPEANLGFVLLTNVSGTPLQRTSREIIWDALLGGEAAETEAIDSPPLRDEPEEVVGTYIANFAAFHDAPFVVKMQNGRLAVDVPGQTVYELLPETAEGKHPFALVPDQIQVAFERDEAGEVFMMKMFQAGLTFELPREGIVLPPDGTEEDFAPYLGSYRDPAIGDVFTIVNDHGRLACDYPGQMVYDLRLPDEDGRWVFRVSDALAISFNRDGEEVESITFHERGTTRICPRVEGGEPLLPSADEIIALRRGREQSARLGELGSLELTARVRFVSAGIEGTHRIRFSADGTFEEENRFEPFGWSRSGYDGKVGWTESAFDEREELSGKYLTQQALSSPATLFCDWSQAFDSIDVVRRSESGDRVRWVVRLVKGDLPPWMVWVDSETGDIIRVESQVLVRNAGTLPQRSVFEDYRDIEGLRLPMRITTENESNGRTVIEFQR